MIILTSLVDCSFSWFHLLCIQTFHMIIYIWHLKIPTWFLWGSKSNVYHFFFSSLWLNSFCNFKLWVHIWFYPWKSCGLEVVIFSPGKHFVFLLQGVGGWCTTISDLETLEGPRTTSWNFRFIFSKNYSICWSIVSYCLPENFEFPFFLKTIVLSSKLYICVYDMMGVFVYVWVRGKKV